MKMKKWIPMLLLLLFAGVGVVLAQNGEGEQEPANAPDSIASAKAAYEKGLAYLVGQQTEEGAWPAMTREKELKPHVGISGLALYALSHAPDAYKTKYADVLKKGAEYIVKHQNEDGSFSDPWGYMKNYTTSVAVMSLSGYGETYKEQIDKAVKYLTDSQVKEGLHEGGFGYGDLSPGKDKPRDYADLSNTGLSLEALRAAGVDPKSEVFQRALKFVESCQNRTENEEITRKLEAEGIGRTDDGDFIYKPDESKAGDYEKDGKKYFKGYGSMTYMGLKSFIYAGVDKDDPRVQAAIHWVKQNFTLDENPGLRTDERPELGQQGLYYYYFTFAKALAVYGDDVITDTAGDKHDWGQALATKLASLQQDDGSWINAEDRWYEGDPRLVTAYALMAYNELWNR
jgi:squalene-hopene/tetraprenyl-beta-curcumene cyclase